MNARVNGKGCDNVRGKKDILFLLQFFYPEYVSSATLPYDTATELVSEGFQVDALCGYPHEYTEKVNVPCKENVNGINVKRVRYLQLSRKKAIGRIVNYLSFTIAMFLRFFSMRKYKTIMVYSNPPILPLVAAFASKIFKSNLVFVAYDLYPEIALKTNALSNGGVVNRLMNFINKFVFKQASAVVVLSTEMKDYVVHNRNIVDDKVYVIPNWYKDDYQTDLQKENNTFSELVSNRFVVGYFGNMGVAQDMDIIKESILHFKNQHDICFVLSGHGSKHSEIEELIETNDIKNVYLYDFLHGQDYLDALTISNCAIVTLEKGLTGLCVPSKTYGFMMQGLPIIAVMDESDIVCDIRQGAGYHIEDNSPQKLVEVIEFLKDNPKECFRSGQISREIYLEKYMPKCCLSQYVKLLKQILEV